MPNICCICAVPADVVFGESVLWPAIHPWNPVDGSPRHYEITEYAYLCRQCYAGLPRYHAALERLIARAGQQ